MNVQIDFVAGSHGNFLEYMCNKFIAQVPMDFNPFNALGASHVKPSKLIQSSMPFRANHYSNLNKPIGDNVVKISISYDDLLPLSSVCLLRAGDSNIDVYLLELDTYNKLKGGYFEDYLYQLTAAYPDLKLTAESPDCPRHILREFFKFGFKDPSIFGFIKKAKELKYQSNVNVFDFSFDSFYSTDRFISKFSSLADWYGSKLTNLDKILEIHTEFINKQIFKDHKSQCDSIINAVKSGQHIEFSNLTVLQEGYINAVLENIYQKEMPFEHHPYFNSTKEIVYYLKFLKCLKSNRFLSKIL